MRDHLCPRCGRLFWTMFGIMRHLDKHRRTALAARMNDWHACGGGCLVEQRLIPPASGSTPQSEVSDG